MIKQNKKRRNPFRMIGWIILIVIFAVLTYYQLLYQSPHVDSGMAVLQKIYSGHCNEVTAVRFSTDDELLVTGSVDSTIQIWNRSTGEKIRTITQATGVTYLDLSTDGRFIATGGYDGKLRIWRVADGALLQECKADEGTVWAVAFSTNDKLAASAGNDKTIKLWETETGKLLRTLKGHDLNAWAVKFSPDDQVLASGSFDRSVKTWNVSDGSIIWNNTSHQQAVVDLAFSHDGNMLATTSDDCTIKLWNLKTHELTRTMQVPEHVQAVAFSPDDKMLMTGGRDKPFIGEFLQNIFGDSEFNKGVSARLWEVSSGRLLQTFRSHANDVMDIAYSHDGKWFATASADKTVEVWMIRSR
jgi:WD40 repeat protein